LGDRRSEHPPAPFGETPKAPAKAGERLDGEIKGTVLQSRLALLERRVGRAGKDRVIGRLPPDDKKRLAGVVMPIAWYPFALGERLDQAIAWELGQGPLVFRALGAQSAEDNLGETHRVYMRSRDPHGLLKHTAQIYSLYYKTGYRTYEWVSPTRAVLRTFESRSYSVADCLTVVGWHEKAIEMCGGVTPRVDEVRCRTRDADRCEYVCDWRAGSIAPPRGP
jgi:uncharacterized protein (TIGR02265 family)